MSRRTRSAVVVGGLVIAAVVPLSGGVASASMSAVPNAIVGCWHRHVPLLTVGTPAGVWWVKITSVGKLVAYRPGTTTSCGGASPDFTANTSVAGSHLTIGPITICSIKGVYSWKATASTLTLHATADKGCPPRAALFTAVWKRK